MYKKNTLQTTPRFKSGFAFDASELAITQGARGSEHIGSALLQIKMVSPALLDTDRIVVTVLQLMRISVLETCRNYFGR